VKSPSVYSILRYDQPVDLQKHHDHTLNGWIAPVHGKIEIRGHKAKQACSVMQCLGRSEFGSPRKKKKIEYDGPLRMI
jgi:hypothetical protein